MSSVMILTASGASLKADSCAKGLSLLSGVVVVVDKFQTFDYVNRGGLSATVRRVDSSSDGGLLVAGDAVAVAEVAMACREQVIGDDLVLVSENGEEYLSVSACADLSEVTALVLQL